LPDRWQERPAGRRRNEVTVHSIDFQKGGGLVPAIVQDESTGEVLMLAFMNEEAFRRTLETGKAWYYSRSRDAYWMKGETSGHVQEIKEIRVDCDADAILLKVSQVGGAACHTGHRSCFYRRVEGDRWIVEGAPVFDPQEVYKK
jgi:phosphoribosyl-AMP cyclohydrolase